jgi:hypothetical protein
MPKIRTKSNHLHSKLTPYLREKCKAKPKVLHELLTLQPELIASSINTSPAPWADPDILSKTNSYEIVRKFKLPVELEESAINRNE